MTRIRNLLCSKKGFSAPWVVVIALIGIMLLVAVSQYIRLMIIASGVRDAVQSAVIATATENYGNVYNGVREGYSGGYSLSGSSWQAKLSNGDIYGRLDSLLGLQNSGNKHSKYNIDGLEYSVYGLSVSVENAPFAPSTTNGIQQFKATSNITLEVPLSFGDKVLSPMKINLSVKSKYTPKF